MSQVRVQGNASGTGILTVTSPNTNSNYTLTLPANTGTLLSSASAGTVLQVVQSVFTGTQTIANNAGAVQITSLSLSITPSSSSNKILLMWNVNANVDNNQPSIVLYKNGSASAYIGDAGSGQSRTSGNLESVGPAYINTIGGCYVDSPATTSAITYAIYGLTSGAGNIYIGRSATDSAIAAYNRSPCSIIAMEIAG